MTGLSLLPIFLIGLLGSVHCIGMCGGIVSALSVTTSGRRVIPIALAAGHPASAAMPLAATGRAFAYNAGRIASYMTAGAIAGGLAAGARTLAGLAPLQTAGYWLANLMLIALGLYLLGAWHGLSRLEAVGQVLWRQVKPLMKHVLPADTIGKSFALGALWGWLPCGMVYSLLLTAMLTASPLSGAMVMLAFGLGTLPTLLALGMMGATLSRWSKRRGVRAGAGLLVLGFGLLGLARAAGGVSIGWLDVFCVSP
jgi:sulfite exporter TauE/SafE